MADGTTGLARLLSGERPRIGPFQLVRPLGAGGFAPVYLATEVYGAIELRTVALKLFSVGPRTGADAQELATGPGAVNGRDARSRIVEEAHALCRVEHPNIVRFLQLAEDESGTILGLAMEHVQGTSLADRLDERKRLPLPEALEIGATIASALAAVHRVGLVHRDVKPANVVEAHGVYKLIDFGIAATARLGADGGSRPSPIVATGNVTGREATLPASAVDGSTEVNGAGTQGYMDPVCLATLVPADASSDLYGLGAMIYECLTGRLPASIGPDGRRLAADVLTGFTPPPNVRALARDVPEGVARIVDSLVSPKRADRPPRAEWVAVELERLRRLVRGRARPLPDEGPFRGLERFEERHRDVYFGRSADVAAGVELLRSHGLLALVGHSGCGKSSLARAGVLPAIADRAVGSWPPTWRSVALSPGADPRRALCEALGLAVLPDEPEDLAAALAARAEQEAVGLAILVDQLEELLTLSDPQGRAYLAALLGRMARAPVPGLRAVVTVRRDLLEGILALPQLGRDLVRVVQLVTPLERTAWVAVLEDALAAYGYALEDDTMREELSRELDVTAEAMPLVGFALARLWDRRDVDRRRVPRAALAAIGGLAGALEQHAEGVLSSLVGSHGARAQDVVGAILVALTTPQGTRARRTLVELARDLDDRLLQPILETLEQARLVVNEDGRFTLAHEALLVQWQRLRTWLADVREDRQLANEVEQAAAGWEPRGQTDRLWRGRRLEDGLVLVRRRTAPLSEAARRFLAASRGTQLRARVGLLVLTGSVVVGTLLLVVTYLQSESDARAAKVHEMDLVRAMVEARNTPESERARAIMDLQVAKKACERDLERARSGTRDAGKAAP